MAAGSEIDPFFAVTSVITESFRGIYIFTDILCNSFALTPLLVDIFPDRMQQHLVLDQI